MAIIKLNVIIVEDSEDDLLLMLRALKKSGYKPHYTRVDTPSDFEEALADEKWQLVISDHSMPVYSAPEALETLKASGRALPFIIVSGTIEQYLASSMLEKGADGYIDKSDLSSLGPTVKRLFAS